MSQRHGVSKQNPQIFDCLKFHVCKCVHMIPKKATRGDTTRTAGQARGLRKSGKSFIKHVVFNVQRTFKTAFQ